MNCSFCGKTSSEVVWLFKGTTACICDDCIGFASAILDGKKSGLIPPGQTTKIDITRYKIHHELAKLVSIETLLRHRFVPLDLYDQIIVLAVADMTQASDAIAELKSVLQKSRDPSVRVESREVNIFLATDDSIQKKLSEFQAR